MQIQIVSMGNKMPTWVNLGVNEYSKRLPSEFNFKLVEIPLIKRNKINNLSQIIKREGAQMLTQTKASDINITLEINGKNLSTKELSMQLKNWQQNGDNLNFMIGGPEGLAPNVLAQSNFAWSLSNLTLPHPLVRIVLIEQLYRAISILRGHPYHK